MRCGGKVNAEWMLPKLMEIAGKAPAVPEETDSVVRIPCGYG